MTLKQSSGEKFDYEEKKASKGQKSKFLRKMLDNCIKEYNYKFLAKWSETLNFHVWKIEHSSDLCYRAEYESQVEEVTIYHENGSMYRGPLVNG